MVKYARQPAEDAKAAKAMGVDLRTSFKNTYNVVEAIKGTVVFINYRPRF